MTRLYFINFFILQWFFVRLARCEKIHSYNYESHVGPDGIKEGRITEMKYKRYYCLMGFVLPGTGWQTPYIYTGKWFIQVSKNKVV